jgi:hypothetical protein
MSTKAEILKSLENYSDDQIIAVPVLRTKEIAEDIWEYATDESITLSDEAWKKIVDQYENAEFYDDEALIDVMKEVLEEE